MSMHALRSFIFEMGTMYQLFPVKGILAHSVEVLDGIRLVDIVGAIRRINFVGGDKVCSLLEWVSYKNKSNIPLIFSAIALACKADLTP